MSRAQAQAQRDAALNRRSGSQSRGGKGSGGDDRPCRVARSAGHAIAAMSTAGRAKTATPSVGCAATQASTQPAAAGWHGALSQSGQWLHGSEAAVCIGAVLGVGIDASAAAGRPAARTARQPKRPARRRTRTIPSLCALSAVSPITTRSHSGKRHDGPLYIAMPAALPYASLRGNSQAARTLASPCRCGMSTSAAATTAFCRHRGRECHCLQ